MKVLIIDNYDSFTYNLYQNVGEILEGIQRQKAQICTVTVKRNDQLSLQEIQNQKYDKIIISPGPGNPADKAYFGVCGQVILELGMTTPIFGVCLGMQGIAHYFGGQVIPASELMHGKTSSIIHDSQGVFEGLPQELEVTRYHSLMVDPGTLPSCLQITAVVKDLGDPSFSFDKTVKGTEAIKTTKTTAPASSTNQSKNQEPSQKLDGKLDGKLDVKSDQKQSQKVQIMGLRHTSYPIYGVQFHPESFATEGGLQIIQNFLKLTTV
jgi:anthranilate synthase component 2